MFVEPLELGVKRRRHFHRSAGNEKVEVLVQQAKSVLAVLYYSEIVKKTILVGNVFEQLSILGWNRRLHTYLGNHFGRELFSCRAVVPFEVTSEGIRNHLVHIDCNAQTAWSSCSRPPGRLREESSTHQNGRDNIRPDYRGCMEEEAICQP